MELSQLTNFFIELVFLSFQKFLIFTIIFFSFKLFKIL